MSNSPLQSTSNFCSTIRRRKRSTMNPEMGHSKNGASTKYIVIFPIENCVVSFAIFRMLSVLLEYKMTLTVCYLSNINFVAQFYIPGIFRFVLADTRPDIQSP